MKFNTSHNRARAVNVPVNLQNRRSQFGSAMLEFTVIGPVLVLLSMVILQFALMFNAKNLVNHASFMAARAGTVGNARLSTIQKSYARALIPLYGGGRNASELAQAYAKATADVALNAKIEILNPTKESFDDWADETLKEKYQARAIPNGGLGFKDSSVVKANSGQSLQDANLIKLKITHGYELKVPLAGSVIQYMLKWIDNGKDSFATRMYAQRRIPVVTTITMQMHSDAVEPSNPVSMPGAGNDGEPSDPGFSEDPVRTPPNCQTIACTVLSVPPDPEKPVDPVDPKDPSVGCQSQVRGDLKADVLFDFNSSKLTAAGKEQIDALASELITNKYESIALTGHTDQLGDPGYNQRLSEQRAEAVKTYLVSKGIDGSKVTTEGMGSRAPKVQLSQCPSGATQISCLAPNRRVSFVYYKSSS